MGLFDDLIEQYDGQIGDGPPQGSTPSAAAAPRAQPVGGHGWTTVFGLNPDGTTDQQDNGVGYWGENTRNPRLEGVALPRAVLEGRFGDLPHARGQQVQVTNPRTGQTATLPLVDVGPGASTGNAMDLTYGAMRRLGGTGKDQMDDRFADAGPAKAPGLFDDLIEQYGGKEASSRDAETHSGPGLFDDLIRDVQATKAGTAGQESRSASADNDWEPASLFDPQNLDLRKQQAIAALPAAQYMMELWKLSPSNPEWLSLLATPKLRPEDN